MRLSILVVEPDDSVLQTIRVMIEVGGHIAFLASNKNSALGILNAVEVDIVVTSLALESVRDGLVLATKAKAMQPGIAVLLIDDLWGSADWHAPQVDECIQKPFGYEELCMAIENLSKLSKTTRMEKD